MPWAACTLVAAIHICTHHDGRLPQEGDGGVRAAKGDEARDEGGDEQAPRGVVGEGAGAHKHVLGRSQHLTRPRAQGTTQPGGKKQVAKSRS